jgi:beta-lactamase regulating signal transducer with metallopeptidase domain
MITTLLSPDFMQRLAGSLLHFVWQGAIIAMVTAILLRTLANRPAQWRYSVSVGALFLMLAAPLLTFMFYTQTGLATSWLLQFISEGIMATSQAAASATATSSWTQSIVVAWMIGVLIFSMRLIAGWRMSRSLVGSGSRAVPSEIQESFNVIMERMAMTAPIRLLTSIYIDTPVAIGWFRPTVLLPITALAGLNEPQLRAVLAHELAHIRRHDFLVNLLQRVVESILFYHPAVWWLSSRIRSEREHCCDDLAVQICDDRSAYAQALMELEQRRTASPDLAVAATGGRLTQRIHRVLGYRIANDDWRPAIAALLFVVVWVTVGAWQPDNTLHAKTAAPIPVPILSPILLQSEIRPATSNLAGAVNALAAIMTAQPPQQTPPAQTPDQGNGVIEGILRDSSGTPEAGVSVGATAALADPYAYMKTPIASITETDKDGRYRLEGLPAGRYYISAGRAQLPTFYPGTLDVAEGRVVVVSAGVTVANINFATEAISKAPKAPLTAPNQNSFVAASNTPGVLNLYVSIQIEGGGKFPVSYGARPPKLTLTDVATKTTYEAPFSSITITIPRNLKTVPNEYKVAIEDLPPGYAVKSVTYRADEPGVRYEDVLAQPMKISLRANDTTFAGGNGSTGAPDLPIVITLMRTTVASARGVRLSGNTGTAVRPALPVPGAGTPPRAANPDPAVYLSGKPGVLYNDGTFDFAGVAPGLHSVIMYPGLLAVQVNVQDRDMDGLSLQAVPAFPYNTFSSPPQTAGSAGSVTTWPSLALRALDDVTKQPIASGYITLNGLGGSSRNYVGASLSVVRIPKLLPGKYAITAEASGYVSKTQSVTVGDGETSIDVQLTREPR